MLVSALPANSLVKNVWDTCASWCHWLNFYLPGQVAEDEVSDNSAECVVCLSDVRDTLILPCRHLCLCNTCADTLRYQANNCPICRLRKPGATGRAAGGACCVQMLVGAGREHVVLSDPCARVSWWHLFSPAAFRALLQIRAMRKKLGPLSPTSFNPIISSQTSDSEEHSVSGLRTTTPVKQALSPPCWLVSPLLLLYVSLQHVIRPWHAEVVSKLAEPCVVLKPARIIMQQKSGCWPLKPPFLTGNPMSS